MTNDSTPRHQTSVQLQSFNDAMRQHLVRAVDREHDWQAFSAQEAQDPNHRRAQIRYMHPEGAPRPGLAPANGFYLVNIAYPPGHYSPMHLHEDAEEVFFVLRGTLKVVVTHEDERYEAVLNQHDMLSVPAGTYRQEINVGDEVALACVIVGVGSPARPLPLSVSPNHQE